SQAAAIPGVELIWTGEDTAPLTSGIPTRHADPAFQATIQPVLAQGVVRYVGEAVAVVVATSIHVAEDALAEIMVEYEELPAIAHVEQALESSDLANETLSSNVIYRSARFYDGVDSVFASSACTVEGSFRCSRVAAAPREARGALAQYDWTTEKLTLWTATQMPSFIRTMIAM